MTDNMMNRRVLVEKSSDADLLREMIGFAAERLMEKRCLLPPTPPHGTRPKKTDANSIGPVGRKLRTSAYRRYLPTGRTVSDFLLISRRCEVRRGYNSSTLGTARGLAL